MGCDYCDAEFSTNKERIEHVLAEHRDELTGHERDSLKRELKQLEDAPEDSGMPVRKIGAAAFVLAALIGGGYLAVAQGIITVSTGPTGAASNGDVPLGPAGSTHHHALFAVSIDGDRIDFSRPQYQMQSREVHFEHGDGSTIHVHATGVTIGYTLNTLGMELTDSCLTLRSGEEYCDDTGDLAVTVNGNGVEDGPGHVIRDGESIRITYNSN